MTSLVGGLKQDIGKLTSSNSDSVGKSDVLKKSIDEKIAVIISDVRHASETVDNSIADLKETIMSYYGISNPLSIKVTEGKEIRRKYVELIAISILLEDDSILMKWGVDEPAKNNFSGLCESDDKALDIITKIVHLSQKTTEFDEEKELLKKLIKKMVESFKNISEDESNPEREVFEKIVNYEAVQEIIESFN